MTWLVQKAHVFANGTVKNNKTERADQQDPAEAGARRSAGGEKAVQHHAAAPLYPKIAVVGR